MADTPSAGGTSDIQIDIVVPTHTRYLSLVGCIGEVIANELKAHPGDREKLAYHLNLVLTEAMTNAIEHANTGSCRETVRVSIHIGEKDLCIRVFDRGQGFDIDAVPLPDLDQPTEGGLGIYFIRTIMDSVTYRQVEGGNILEMRKKLA